MRPSPNILTRRPLADPRSAELIVAWMDSADDAHEAYLAWRDAGRCEEADAYYVYRAALDREEAAARALQRAGA